jgi:hypothetical protein
MTRTPMHHQEVRRRLSGHHDNLLEMSHIGRARLQPSRGGSNHARLAEAKPFGRPQDLFLAVVVFGWSHREDMSGGTHQPFV